MGWKRRVLGVTSLLMWAACGPAPERVSAETPPGAEQPSTGPEPRPAPPIPDTPDSGTETPDGGSVPPDEEPLPEDPGEDTPPPAEGVDGPTLEPAACVPWPGLTAPREEQPCEVTTQFSAGSERRRYDAEGHLLEHRTWSASGTLTYAEANTWSEGLRLHQRIEGTPGHSGSEKEWTYDAERRLVQRTDRSGTGGAMTHQLHYTNGQVQQIDHLFESEPVNATTYEYDAKGRLARIESGGDCDLDLSRCEAFHYDAAGQLRSIWRRVTPGLSSGEEYDEHGRLIATSWRDPEESGRTTRVHDQAGRLMRTEEGRYGYDATTLTTRVSTYDTEERPVLEWKILEHNANLRDEEPTQTVTRSTTRRTYLCGTSLLHEQAWDGNEDAVLDARCTYERDAKGRLLREECTGGAEITGFLRRESRYDCH